MLQWYGLGSWAIQLPAVMAIIGSALFRNFEQWVSMLRVADQSRLGECLRLLLEAPSIWQFRFKKLYNITA